MNLSKRQARAKEKAKKNRLVRQKIKNAKADFKEWKQKQEADITSKNIK